MKVSIFCRSLLFTLLMYYAIPASAMSTILIFGDSLSAGYGLAAGEDWPSQLATKLQSITADYQVVNASVSGLTAAEGAQQIHTLLEAKNPQILIIALGSNDALRGMPILNIKTSLTTIINAAKDKGVKPLLVGFQIPPNYGPVYTQQFAQIFPDLSEDLDIPLVPFLLGGFAEDTSYFQTDRLHPTAAAQPMILNNVWTYLQPML